VEFFNKSTIENYQIENFESPRLDRYAAANDNAVLVCRITAAGTARPRRERRGA
jgi:hypothetical protein